MVLPLYSYIMQSLYGIHIYSSILRLVYVGHSFGYVYVYTYMHMGTLATHTCPQVKIITPDT